MTCRVVLQPRRHHIPSTMDTVVWAARNSDDRKQEVLEITKAVEILEADLAAPHVPNSIIVVNAKFPYRCFLSDWEKCATPYFIICLDNSARLADFSMCMKIFYI